MGVLYNKKYEKLTNYHCLAIKDIRHLLLKEDVDKELIAIQAIQGHVLPLRSRKLHYNGHKFYFVCIMCGRNCNKLYYRGKKWACMQCQGLNHVKPSKKMRKIISVQKKIEKLETKWGNLEEQKEKPFYIARKTWEKVLIDYQEYKQKLKELEEAM